MSERYQIRSNLVLNKWRNFWVAAISALCVGVYLWQYSDLPPYGPISNELSNHSWGIIVDIAHKWRNFDFSFWDRGIGGGTSLFSSGFYPIFYPTNILALFQSDDVFFKYKLIEPYVVGVFLAVFLLLEVFAVRWPYAVFGGLLYMGLGFGRFATVADAPYFLWGCALFPALIYAFGKFSDRHWVIPSAAAGLVVSVQFFAEGAPQFLQVFLWSLVFLTVQSFWSMIQKGPSARLLIHWIGGCAVFCFFALGLCAIQFLPTLNFSFSESVRPYSAQYSINNFPIFHRYAIESKGSLAGFLYGIIMSPGGISWRAIIALWLLALGLMIVHWKSFVGLISRQSILGILCVTTGLYFLVPTLAGELADVFPFLEKVFHPLSLITFAYSVYIIDFCAMLVLVFILDHAAQMVVRSGSLRRVILTGVTVVAVIFVTLPMILAVLGNNNILLTVCPALESFVPRSIKSAGVVFILGIFLSGYYFFHFRQRWITYIAWGALIFIGFMTLVLSFNWNSKGQQSHLSLYRKDTPEVQYYRDAHKKFYLPYNDLYDCGHNFNLLYEIDGTSGFLQVPPKRFNQFMASYHSDRLRMQKEWWVPKYRIIKPSGALATRFPVDFTTISKDQSLNWPGFEKKINGQDFDVWERIGKTERVYFADTLRVENYDQIIAAYDQPLGHVFRITNEDAAALGIGNKSFAEVGKDKPRYSRFIQWRGDYLSFETDSDGISFVMVPEIFQKGWRVFVDDRPVHIFPVDFLFVGFELPAGHHVVKLKFSPPYFVLGLVMSLLSCMVLIISGICFRRSLYKINEKL